MPSSEKPLVLPSELNEKCGVFGVFDPHVESTVHLTKLGLSSLQHRGQESAGIATSDSTRITSYSAQGLVMQIFDDDFNFDRLPGGLSVGHTRYPTSSVSTRKNAHQQPVVGRGRKSRLALAHNGNIPDTTLLEKFIDENNIRNDDLNDSEMMHVGIEHYMKKGATLEEAALMASPLITGAYSLAMMSENQLVAMRDPYGLRPLSIGRQNGNYFISSETCAFGSLGAEHIRDVMPGEMITIDENGMRSQEFAKGEQKLDIFEFVYFARPDSELLGKSVEIVRKNMGKRLAQEMMENGGINADMVIGIPDSGTPAGYGFAQESGLPHEEGFVKNRYVGRTFQMPGQITREQMVKMKLNPLKEVVRGKDVLLIDDSIVRGTTSKALVKMMRDCGARRVHLAITCPPIRYPDFYGIDTPEQKDLFSYRYRTNTEMRLALSADSLTFLSLEGLIDSIGLPREMLSTSAFTGEYPADIGKHKSEIVHL